MHLVISLLKPRSFLTSSSTIGVWPIPLLFFNAEEEVVTTCGMAMGWAPKPSPSTSIEEGSIETSESRDISSY
jgi:hypothetical protein